jgi:hypothetical protein
MTQSIHPSLPHTSDFRGHNFVKIIVDQEICQKVSERLYSFRHLGHNLKLIEHYTNSDLISGTIRFKIAGLPSTLSNN